MTDINSTDTCHAANTRQRCVFITLRVRSIDISAYQLFLNSRCKNGRLSLSTNGDKCAMVNLGGSIKSLILSFNIQKCEFCAQI